MRERDGKNEEKNVQSNTWTNDLSMETENLKHTKVTKEKSEI